MKNRERRAAQAGNMRKRGRKYIRIRLSSKNCGQRE